MIQEKDFYNVCLETDEGFTFKTLKEFLEENNMLDRYDFGKIQETLIKHGYHPIDVCRNALTAEDAQFLHDLGNKIASQDDLGTRKPVMWTIQEDITITSSDDDYDVIEVCDDVDHIFTCETCEEILDYFKNEEDLEDIDESVLESLEEAAEYGSPQDLIDELNDELGRDYRIYFAKKTYGIVENAYFLTREACEKHIEENGYHYNNPVPYCASNWRNPEMEQLVRILTSVDWIGLVASQKTCCLCGKPYSGYGNNASPLKDGLCCDECNRKKVVPARLACIESSVNKEEL